MARMRMGHLATFCHRVGTSLQAGIDVRRLWESEAQRGSFAQRAQMAAIRDRIMGGATLSEAFSAAGGYFPPLVCEMVDVGERTGRMDEIFFRLSDHYNHLLRLRRYFFLGIAWPLIQLVLALVVIGALIAILGWIGAEWNNRPISVFGLYGTRGLVIYLAILGTFALSIAAGVYVLREGWINADPLLRLLMRVPGIGNALQTMALSRLTWSLAVATDSEMDAFRAIEIGVRSTQNPYYTSQLEVMRQSISRREPMCAAFRATGRYPDEFLDALETGETAGRISESMHHLAKVLEDRAKNHYRLLTIFAAVSVFLLVAAILIFMIFKLAMIYLTPIYDTLHELGP